MSATSARSKTRVFQAVMAETEVRLARRKLNPALSVRFLEMNQCPLLALSL